MTCLICDEDVAPSCVDGEHARASERRAAASASKWSPLVVGDDGGGWRQFLDGRPVRSGARLELQSIESREDDFGSYTVFLQAATAVSYEVRREPEGWYRAPVLYVFVGGHVFTAPLESWMRFRWPADG